MPSAWDSAVATLLADAELPDPGQASIVPTAIALGGLIGGLLGSVLKRSPEEVRHDAFRGGLYFGVAALLTYLALLVGDLS